MDATARQTDLFDADGQPIDEAERLRRECAERRATDRPFRTAVGLVDDELLEALNEAENNKRARRYLPTTRTIGQIHDQKTANWDRRAAWAFHPDERVPLELCGRYRDPLWTEIDYGARGRMEAMILDRALADAEREGVVWTPLLDALGSGGRWPSDWHREPGQPSAAEQAARLADWIEAQPTADDLEPLLVFESPALWRTVAAHAPQLDEALTERLLEKHRVAPYLGGNPHLDEARRAQIVDHLRRVTETPASGAPQPRSTTMRAASHLAARYHEAGHEWPDDFDWAERLTSALVEHNDPPRSIWETRLYALLDAGEAGSSPTEEQLIEVIEAVDPSPRFVPEMQRLVRSPHTGPATYRAILDRTGHFKLRRTIAYEEDALTDPGVLDRLLETTSGKLIGRVLREASGEQVGRIFARLAEEDAPRALSMLRRYGLEEHEEFDVDAAFRTAAAHYCDQQPARAIRKIEEGRGRWGDLEDRIPLLSRALRALIDENPSRGQQMLEEKDWIEALPDTRRSLRRRLLASRERHDPKDAIERLENRDPSWMRWLEEDELPDHFARALKAIGRLEKWNERYVLLTYLQDHDSSDGASRAWLDDLSAEQLAPLVHDDVFDNPRELFRHYPRLKREPALVTLAIDRTFEDGSGWWPRRLGEELTGEPFGMFWRRYREEQPRRAARYLERAEPEQIAGLTREDLKPLLGAEDAKIRQAALLAMGHTRPSDPAPIEPEAERPGRTR